MRRASLSGCVALLLVTTVMAEETLQARFAFAKQAPRGECDNPGVHG